MGLLTVFSGPYALFARIAVYAALVAGIFGYGWVKGNQHGTEKLTNYQAAQVLESQKVIVRQGKITEKIVTEYVKVQGKTQTVTQTVQQEVTKYVEKNPGLVLDRNWGRLHDAAALNTVPDSSVESDGTGGETTAAQALATVTGNYGACNRTADRLDALQKWIREQAK